MTNVEMNCQEPSDDGNDEAKTGGSVRYELVSAEIDICYKNRNLIRPGCTLFQSGADKIVRIADSCQMLADAIMLCTTEICEIPGSCGKMYRLHEYIARESFYDADGVLLKSSIIAFSKIRIGVINKSGKLLSVFEDILSAERFALSAGGTLLYSVPDSLLSGFET